MDFEYTPENVPRQTGLGKRMACIPTYINNQAEPLDIIEINPAKCYGCLYRETHGIHENMGLRVPKGRGRYDVIQNNQISSAVLFNQIQTALFLLNYIARGRIDNTSLIGAGQGNNTSITVRYEVTGTDGDLVHLKGLNPKRIPVSKSIDNPDWIPGQNEHYLNLTSFARLPSCSCSMEIQYPSVLFAKMVPLVSRIIAPSSTEEDDVSFTVECPGFDLDNLCEPIDASLSVEKYYVVLRWEANFPDTWQFFDEPIDSQFSYHKDTIYTPSIYTFKNADGNDTRVIYPNGDKAIFIRLHGVDTVSELTESAIRERIQTTGQWVTTIDLSDLVFTSAEIEYWSETSESDTDWIQFPGSCKHSRRDPSVTYKHDIKYACDRIESTGFPTFKDVCWQPDCSDFSLDFTPPNNPQFWANLWSAAWWIEEQVAPGFSGPMAWKYTKKDIPSIQSLCGSFCSIPMSTFGEKKSEYLVAPYGKRIIFMEESGDEVQKLVFGAISAATYDFGEASYIFNAATNNDDEGTITELLQDDLYKYRGYCDISTYTSGGQSLTLTNNLVDSEAYIPGVDLTEDVANSTVERLRRVYV